MAKNSDYLEVWMTTKRIETLVDGIFAIAMTLLVLTIGAPENLGSLSEAAFQQRLDTFAPKIFIYALSFFLLSAFWRVNHQQFYYIKKINPTLISINTIWLMFVALVPFSTLLMGKYSHFYTSNVIFQLNLFFVGFLYYLNWYYATENNLVDENLDPKIIKDFRQANLLLPVLSLIAIGLSFFVYSWSNLVYFVVPLFKRFYNKYSTSKSEKS